MPPSMKCSQCGEVKRCRMYHDVRTNTDEATGKVETVSRLEYLCTACARELGYETKKVS